MEWYWWIPIGYLGIGFVMVSCMGIVNWWNGCSFYPPSGPAGFSRCGRGWQIPLILMFFWFPIISTVIRDKRLDRKFRS